MDKVDARRAQAQPTLPGPSSPRADPRQPPHRPHPGGGQEKARVQAEKAREAGPPPAQEEPAAPSMEARREEAEREEAERKERAEMLRKKAAARDSEAKQREAVFQFFFLNGVG